MEDTPSEDYPCKDPYYWRQNTEILKITVAYDKKIHDLEEQSKKQLLHDMMPIKKQRDYDEALIKIKYKALLMYDKHVGGA